LKILVVKLHALGDLVIATPALRRLRDGLSDARIDLLTTTWCAPAIEGSPFIDRSIVVSNDIFFKPGPDTVIPFMRLVSRLKREKYDAAVIFHKHHLVKLFVRLVGISKRFHFNGDTGRSSVFLNEMRHCALTAWELADLAVCELGGVQAEPPFLEDLRYEWYVTRDEQELADRILSESGVDVDGYAVLLPGGGVNPSVRDTVRRWSVDKFVKLAERVNEELDLEIVLSGGGDDLEIAEQVEKTSRVKIVNLCGRLNMRISAAIMQKARLVICNDTGPLHVAAAVGVPVVGIFGPTGERMKLPPGKTTYAACLDLSCRPCYFGIFKGCIFNKIRCMDELSVDDVMSVVHRAYNRRSLERET